MMFKTVRFIIYAIYSCLFLFLPSCKYSSSSHHWDHIVIVFEENKNYTQVVTDSNMAEFESRGASFTSFYGITHPSQPNYIGFFSGDLQGVTDNLDHDLNVENLSTLLKNSGYTHISYAEGLPYPGFRGSTSGFYARKHNPAASFTNIPDSEIQPFTSFPTDFSKLPALSIVIPDLNNDMHDGTVSTGGIWLKNNLDQYAQWAMTHNSLLIITFDECDVAYQVDVAQIYTVIIGEHVKPRKYNNHFNHYSLLAFIEDNWMLPRMGQAVNAEAVSGEW